VIRVLQFWCRLVILRRLAYHKGEDGSSIRWFAEYDSSVQALRHRHSRMLLADLVVIMQGASPFNAAVNFTDDLSEVFRKSGQSMQAACHVLRDDSLFQATSGIQSATDNLGILTSRPSPPSLLHHCNCPRTPPPHPSAPHPHTHPTPHPHPHPHTPNPAASHPMRPNFMPCPGPSDPPRSFCPLPAGPWPPHSAGPERKGRNRSKHRDPARLGDLCLDASP
jgi:hypothetical protein